VQQEPARGEKLDAVVSGFACTPGRRHERLDQLSDLCGREFDGLLAEVRVGLGRRGHRLCPGQTRTRLPTGVRQLNEQLHALGVEHFAHTRVHRNKFIVV